MIIEFSTQGFGTNDKKAIFFHIKLWFIDRYFYYNKHSYLSRDASDWRGMEEVQSFKKIGNLRTWCGEKLYVTYPSKAR